MTAPDLPTLRRSSFADHVDLVDQVTFAWPEAPSHMPVGIAVEPEAAHVPRARSAFARQVAELTTAATQPAADADVEEAPAPAFDALAVHGDVDAMIGQLTLRDTAREALRARLIMFGAGHHRRSAYELVFIFLAFAAMVLLITPPIVEVIEAIRSSKGA